MAREHYTSRQIAAHFAQGYLEKNEEPFVVRKFSSRLGKRLPELKKLGSADCYQEIGSLLYCVNDMVGSCRDAAISSRMGEMDQADRRINRAAKRVREIGTLLTEIRDEHPQEYENSCRQFVEEWRDIRFDKGKGLLQTIEESMGMFSVEETPAPVQSDPVLTV